MEETKKFSVVLPIHNEANLLPYSLPSIFGLNPDEVVFLFDRCTDDSVEVAERLSVKFGGDCCFQFVVPPYSPSWHSRLAFLRRYGTKLAYNDLILFTACDLVLDPKIKKYLGLLGKDGVELVSFLHKNFPIDWRNLMKRALVNVGTRGLGSERWLAGVMFYNRLIASTLENEEEVKKFVSGEDTYLHKSICKFYRSRCFVTNTLHLRPRGTSRDFMCGELYWSLAKRSFFVTLASSLFLLRFDLWRGYVHERFGGN